MERLKMPSRKAVEDRIRSSQAISEVFCPVCGDEFDINHSKWYLPCKDMVRCTCGTEYTVEMALSEDGEKASAEIVDIDMSKTKRSAIKKRASL